MKWRQALRQHFPTHKYVIDAKQLGDTATLPWSNLGDWTATASYPVACRQLALQLAQAVHVSKQDRLLDLGCGQGASLKLWLDEFQLEHVAAMEMQAAHVEHIQKNLDSNYSIYADSFLNAKDYFPIRSLDVIVCIDAAYHCHLNSFLQAVQPLLNSKGRLGFHGLMLSEKWHSLNALQRQKYAWLLKAADVKLEHLMLEPKLQQSLLDFDFQHIQIEDYSERVLAGFAHYYQLLKSHGVKPQGLDGFKIQMTAKLCQKLYADGLVRYVQVTACLSI